MLVATRPALGTWGVAERVSGTQAVSYPALAMSAAGDLLASWSALDAANTGSVWASVAPTGAAWSTPTRLSGRAEATDWPSAAFAADGSIAIVAWTDNNTNTAKATVLAAGTWTRRNLGSGYWGGPVSVAAGSSAAVAGWATPYLGNPNAAKVVGRTWQ